VKQRVVTPVRTTRRRLDEEVVARGLAETRSRAQALIIAGDLLVNGRPCLRPGQPVGAADLLEVAAAPRFVSRGGEKLAHALDRFAIDVSGLVAADLGASTGGFTDCLLQRGARRVYAVDVGYGQLHQRLREDPRVRVMDRVNARYLEELPERIEIVTIDVSFISLDLILPVAARLLVSSGRCVPLIKPQFEAGRAEVGKGGVVRSPDVRRRCVERVLEQARQLEFSIRGLTASPLLGPAGNVEFLASLRFDGVVVAPEGISAMIERAMVEAQAIEAVGGANR
jgi:23S rRNA (cytidine1920-2'-O)/16S rRNA (cytidine1409-2'-O)-methyltransferase